MRGPLAFVLAVLALAGCNASPPGFSGTVQTEYVSVGSTVGGRVIATEVSAGQTVRRGAIIVRLDPALPQAQYEEALAQERAAQDALRALRSGTLPSQIEQARGSRLATRANYTQTVGGAKDRITAARAALANARANAVLAERNYQRTSSLTATGDVSRQSLDEARAARDQARAGVRQAQAQLTQLERADIPGETAAARANAVAARRSYEALANGARPAQLAQAQAQVRDAAASAAHALAELREATVSAPTGGVVASFNLHPGDILAANQIAAIIDTFADPYVYIYASQGDLQRIRSAKSLIVHSDAGAGTFSGRVEAYDRTAQFTPQNVETEDQRAELVYGVKIRIHDPEHELLDGTTVTVTLR
ncbi:MAG TPA: HlyD family efflux transporter periplasmic adaptor subunit [Candidatus Baltobacteraceae bacterium]|nr:HlyD family efflux transporter periplasmic adaptor subunit [Candidatus Baltobacteraceae bacterium]